MTEVNLYPDSSPPTVYVKCALISPRLKTEWINEWRNKGEMIDLFLSIDSKWNWLWCIVSFVNNIIYHDRLAFQSRLSSLFYEKSTYTQRYTIYAATYTRRLRYSFENMIEEPALHKLRGFWEIQNFFLNKIDIS